MKKFFKFIFFILIIAIIGVGVYAFAFEKTIPTSLVENYVKDVDTQVLVMDSMEKIYQLPEFKIQTDMEAFDNYVYSGDTNTLESKDFLMKAEVTIEKTGDKDNFALTVTGKSYDYVDNKFVENKTSFEKYYVENGKFYKKIDDNEVVEVSEANFKTSVQLAIALFTPLGVDEESDLISYAKDNIEKVTQIGFNVTLHSKKIDTTGNETLMQCAFDVVNKTIVEFDTDERSYDELNRIKTQAIKKCKIIKLDIEM